MLNEACLCRAIASTSVRRQMAVGGASFLSNGSAQVVNMKFHDAKEVVHLQFIQYLGASTFQFHGSFPTAR